MKKEMIGEDKTQNSSGREAKKDSFSKISHENLIFE